jgi:methylenetetrahydrofolate reductase (NADPH)
VFLGAAENPNVPPVAHRAARLAKKIANGAQFVQTQYCYDLPLLRDFLKSAEDLGIADKAFMIIGVGPLRNAKSADWMRRNVPGIHIPDSVINRLAGAQDQTQEGINLCVDLMQEIREMKGVHGLHVMAFKQEDRVPEIVERSGVLAGRVPWYPGRDATAA